MEDLVKQKAPTVSVVIAFYNAGKYIADTVESVLKQTYQDWELLLVDDGSIDNGTAIAQQYAKAHPGKIRYLEHPGHKNIGAPTTRNLGFRNARGKYIAMLDADDIWVPNKLKEQVALMEKHPEAGMICGAVEQWWSWDPNHPKERFDTVYYTGGPQNALTMPPDLFQHLYPLKTGMAPTPSDLLVKKEVVDKVGGFEERFHHQYQLYDDQSFLVKVYLFFPVYVSNQVWIKYRRHAESCIATVHRNGQYDEVRKFFLVWFRGYLSKHGFRGTEIWDLLQKALIPYRHPLVRRFNEGLMKLGRS